MATGVVPVSDRGDTREHGDALNRVVFRDNGTESATVLWKNSTADYVQTIVNADAAGDALAVLLPATAATATPSAANSSVLLNAAGVSVGAGKVLKLWNAAGTFGISMNGTAAATSDKTITLQNLAGTLALLGAQNAGNLLFNETPGYNIGAAGATRPNIIYSISNIIAGGNLQAGAAVLPSGQTTFGFTVPNSGTAVVTGDANRITFGPGFQWLLVTRHDTGGMAIAACMGAANTVVKVFETTVGAFEFNTHAGVVIAIYHDGTNYAISNRTGGNVPISVLKLGA